MRKHFNLFAIALIGFSTLFVTGCESRSAEDKVKASVEETKYSLKAEERLLAETNAKQFFNKDFPAFGGAMKKGVFIDCRPTDSNFNGLVTCNGFLPSQKNELMETTVRYCGYQPKIVGCTNEDK